MGSRARRVRCGSRVRGLPPGAVLGSRRQCWGVLVYASEPTSAALCQEVPRMWGAGRAQEEPHGRHGLVRLS